MMLPASAAQTISAVPADPGRTLAGLTDDVNVPLRIDWPVDIAADQSAPGRALSDPDTARNGLPGSELLHLFLWALLLAFFQVNVCLRNDAVEKHRSPDCHVGLSSGNDIC